MDKRTLLLIIILVLLFLGLVLFVLTSHKQEDKKPNYYTLFVLGAIWLPMGVAFHMYMLASIGLLFILISLLHQKKWQKQDTSWTNLTLQQKFFLIVIFIGLLTGIAAYLIAK